MQIFAYLLLTLIVPKTHPKGNLLLDFLILKVNCGTSLVVQWLRIHLPMQETQVRALVQEDPICRGATKPVRHNY